MTETLEQLETPALILDEARMARNIARMQSQLQRLGVGFRPHVKTCKSVEVAQRLTPTQRGPITVSTLREAEQFAAAGYTDILYAVSIAPNKLDHVQRLQAKGVRLSVILDSVAAARCVADHAGRVGGSLDVLIEIDCDSHRAGVKPQAPELLEIARTLATAGMPPRGVMTHAGGSYDCRSLPAIQAMAEQERVAVVQAAERLRAAGLDCPVVSVGSTPTALFAQQLPGVTEVRAGVYVFFDLVMAGLQVCAVDDIALSVLSSVIGHQHDKGWALVDAGWMALSRDRGTAAQAQDQGYGLVCDIDGRPIDDLIVVAANQEHGIVASRSGRADALRELPLGTLLRILPNHACPTAAQYDHYQVLQGGRDITARWPRFNGW